jgi:hypothetical protein
MENVCHRACDHVRTVAAGCEARCFDDKFAKPAGMLDKPQVLSQPADSNETKTSQEGIYAKAIFGHPVPRRPHGRLVTFGFNHGDIGDICGGSGHRL